MGVRVTVDEPTSLAAIRFFKDALETGTHTGKVWSSAGTVLASVVFAGESASGWQQQSLVSPLQLQPGTTYVVSVNLNAFFVLTNQALASQVSSGPLRSLTDKNGVYGATAGTFPNTGSKKNANYFVDLVIGDLDASSDSDLDVACTCGDGCESVGVGAGDVFSGDGCGFDLGFEFHVVGSGWGGCGVGVV